MSVPEERIVEAIERTRMRLIGQAAQLNRGDDASVLVAATLSGVSDALRILAEEIRA